MIKQLQGLTDTHTSIKQELNNLYSCECGHHLPGLADKSQDEAINELVNKMIKRVYDAKGMPATIDKKMVTHFANIYFEGVESGYGSKLGAIDYNTPDYAMLKNLERSVFHFSAAKNYQQLKATSKALLNEEGKLRSWTEFRNAAYEINQQHTMQWLKAEYELAVASGQMAATWVRATENAEELPLLEYDATLDGHTSQLCRELNGIIKPINHSFWDIYFPPNHFGCRADAKSLPGGKITPDADIVHPDKMHPMFKTNMAKNGLAFPKDHPYFNGLPAQVTEQADKLIDTKPAAPAVFTPAKTIKQAEQYASETLNKKFVSFKGLDIQVANELNKSTFKLNQALPDVQINGMGSAQAANKSMRETLEAAYKETDYYKGVLRTFGKESADKHVKEFTAMQISKVGKNTIAWSTYERKATLPDGTKLDLSKYRGVFVNHNMGKAMELLQKECDIGRKSGWFTPAAKDFSYIMAHEFGHEVDKTIRFRDNLLFKAIYEREWKAGSAAVISRLSKYGALAGGKVVKRPLEMIAEAWAEFVCSNEPRELSKEIGELMLKEYYEKFIKGTGPTIGEWMAQTIKTLRQ